MTRFKLPILLVFVALSSIGFAQTEKFITFYFDFSTYRESNTTISYSDKDSVPDWNNYVLTWVHNSGTYGGSNYCCGGVAFFVKDAEDISSLTSKKGERVDPELTPIDYSPPVKLGRTYYKVGTKYILEVGVQPEPIPTNNFHYIYTKKYYVLKNN